MTYDQARVIADRFRSKYPKLSLDARFGRAMNILRRGDVQQAPEPGTYYVRSEHDRNTVYLVDVTTHSCPCEDSRNGFVCKHRRAVGMLMLA